MKISFYSILIAVTIVFMGCIKEDTVSINKVDIRKYELNLSNDYYYSLLSHVDLKEMRNQARGHTEHHSKESMVEDSLNYQKMFKMNDSLFSVHFYEFCIDMIQNSAMMSTSEGPGRNSSMMGGNGDMMNGSVMGTVYDLNKMVIYLDSIKTSNQTLTDPDYLKSDSLMFNQLTLCGMMTRQTENITKLYDQMQALRKNHTLLHGEIL